MNVYTDVQYHLYNKIFLFLFWYNKLLLTISHFVQLNAFFNILCKLDSVTRFTSHQHHKTVT